MVAAAIGASAVGSLASGALTAGAAGSAADKQAQAAQQASALLGQYYGKASDLLNPYISAGSGALGQIQNLTGTNAGGNPLTATLTKPFNPTMADLEATPGYQFTKDQGLKAVQNSMAAKGLGGSGEALAGAANYSSGLASQTYQQQFSNYLNQNQQIFNLLNSQSGAGQNAASNLSSLGIQAGGAQGQALVGAGNAQAAGILGANQGITSAINGISGLGSQYVGLNTLQNLTGGSSSTNNTSNLSSFSFPTTSYNPLTGYGSY